MCSIKFIYLNVEPSFQCKCVTKKKELIIIKNKNLVVVSWIDSTFWSTFNVSMDITLTKKKEKKGEKKYSV